MPLRLLITGAQGQLGVELRRLLTSKKAEIGPIPFEYHDAIVDYTDYDQLDITNQSAVERWFHEHHYNIVINCAAATNVDGCEKDKSGAYALNAQGPKNLATCSYAQGTKIVHISTDYVFPGNEPGNRIETDKTAPRSVYGCSKLTGELEVMAANPQHFICRTAWLYGYKGKNFVKTMQLLGKKHAHINVVDDQVGNPTSANDLAFEILRIALTNNFGIYHITNNGTCSWAEFASRIMEKSGLNCTVSGISSAEYKKCHPESADRPAYSGLRNKHLEDTIGNKMRSWQDALDEHIKRLHTQERE